MSKTWLGLNDKSDVCSRSKSVSVVMSVFLGVSGACGPWCPAAAIPLGHTCQPVCPLQPLQLREPLHSLLLAMCEDQPRRRRPLQAVLEACRVHQEEVAVYPAPASLHVSRLVGSVLGTISEVSFGTRLSHWRATSYVWLLEYKSAKF